MEKIVKRLLNIDFHIHSHASCHKDHALVSNGTKENAVLLLSKLQEHNIDMFAITDHDCFDGDLYRELKTREGNSFEKVFPGIEFSVWMDEPGKQIHVIAIFDDSSDENISKIERELAFDPSTPPSYDVIDHQCFSEAKFRDILNRIGVNAILIVHQKGSALPSAKPSNHDLKSLGEAKMNELINVEYFDALEFKKPTAHFYQTLFARTMNNATYDKVKFITGSDCHQWEHYPRHDATTADSEMRPTYLKCLPTFRGLVMCVTDYSRITQNELLFADVNRYIDALEIDNRGKPISIPLSKGINVIIGDNSTGKSALLHKLTNYSKLDGTTGLPKNLSGCYDAFFDSMGFILKTSLKEGTYDFSVQGGVRHKFEGGNYFEEFSKDKYPELTDSAPYIDYVKQSLNPLYESIKAKHKLDRIFSNLPDAVVAEKPVKSAVCKATKCQSSVLVRNSKLKKILSELDKIITAYDVLLKEIEDASEIKTINEQKEYLEGLRTKYKTAKQKEDYLSNVIEAINIGINAYSEKTKELIDASESRYKSFEEGIQRLASDIVDLQGARKNITRFDYSSIPSKKIVYNTKVYGDVEFCCRFNKPLTQVDGSYVESLVQSVIKGKNKNKELYNISESELSDIVKEASDEAGKSGLDLLTSKIDAQIADDFASKKVLTKNGGDCTQEFSAGFNATMYFTFLGNDSNEKRIYLIDQPEDDISQANLSKTTIPDFKKVSGSRQVILVTHNPQFVVNLDADNVICISKSADGKTLNIQSGALEYKDDETDVLSIVENNLDGGEESLKKRWRRYEKSIEDKTPRS